MTTDTILPTQERIRQAGDRYVRPSIDRQSVRPYGRVSPWHELLERKRTITPEQAMAARELEMLWHGAHRPRSATTAAYGAQAPRSTPTQHMTEQELPSPAWRTTCHNRLNAVKHKVTPRCWSALMFVIENDADTRQVGYHLGARSDATAWRTGGKALREGLHALAVHWKMIELFHHRPP